MLNEIVKPIGLIGTIILALVVAAIMLSFGTTANQEIAEASGCEFVTGTQSDAGAHWNSTIAACQNYSGADGVFFSHAINVSRDGGRGFSAYSGFQTSIFLLAVVAVIIGLLGVVLRFVTGGT